MHPELIKAHIRMNRTTPKAIADGLGVSHQSGGYVINGKLTPPRIRAAIAQVTGLPQDRLWPPKAPSGLRRVRPSRTVHAQGVAL
jgi:lambda repressor-like predicted transcriptional regulator